MVAISHSSDNSQTLKHIPGDVNDHCALNIYYTLLVNYFSMYTAITLSMQPERQASYICTFWNNTRISGEVIGRIRSTSVAANEVMTHDICHRTSTKEPKFETSSNTIKPAYNGISVGVFQIHFRATLTAYEILVQFCSIGFPTLPISICTSLLRLLLPLVLPLYPFPFVFLLR